MVKQVIRAVELPLSISLGVARRSVAIAGRVTGWALSAVQGESDGEPSARPAPATTSGRSSASTSATVYDEPATADVGPEAGEATKADELVAADSSEEDSEPTPVAESELPTVAESSPVEEAEPAPGADSGVEDGPGTGPSVRARTPHSPLNNPITEPDLTEWPDPYDQREDPRDPGGDGLVFGDEIEHLPPGAISTSEPHPDQDPEAVRSEVPKRDKLDR